LLADEPRRAELSVAGRQRILEKFSWQVCAAEMVNYYRAVLDNADR
jgi:glycosyltransferase involved in cell wall biosynthesis